MAVLYYGASHVLGGIYLLPDGEEYCCADGSLYGQDPVDEYHGLWTCWRCGGLGVVKMYRGHGYALVQCDVCRGERTSDLMPNLQPRHIHDWQPYEDEVPKTFEPQRCPCGAMWLKKSERQMVVGKIAGMAAIASLIQRWQPEGREATNDREGL